MRVFHGMELLKEEKKSNVRARFCNNPCKIQSWVTHGESRNIVAVRNITKVSEKQSGCRSIFFQSNSTNLFEQLVPVQQLLSLIKTVLIL